MWELTRGSNYSSGAASQQVVALHVGSGALIFNALKLTIFILILINLKQNYFTSMYSLMKLNTDNGKSLGYSVV